MGEPSTWGTIRTVERSTELGLRTVPVPVRIALGLPPPADIVTLHDRQHHVEIELADTTRLTGTLLDSSPADRTRVIDHLDRPGQWIRLWTPEWHYLINKAQIVGVTEP